MDKSTKQFPDPSIDILSLKPLQKVQKLTNNSKLIDFVEKNPLPSISSRTIDHLKSLSNNNESTTQNQIIEEALHDFPYQEVILNFFAHQFFNTTSENEISLYYILFSFVAWKIKYISLKNTDSTIFMLESLLHASTISESTLPTSAFLYTITSFLEISNLQEFSKFLPLIRSFFIQNSKLPETAFALFPHCIYLLIAKKEDFNQYLHEFYEILKQVVSKSQNEFPQQIAEETLIALSPSISQLEQTPIFIFSLLARFASSPTIIQFLITLAVIIVDSSMKSDIEINLPNADESKVKEYEIAEHTPGITMHFPQIPTFLNGFDINNLIPFREQENIQSLITNDLILDIKTIVMIMYDNDEYSYQYGSSLINYLNQNAENPKLINAFPVVIYSFILLRMKGNKVPSISELFKNKIIFNPAVICDDSMTDLNSLRGGALELYLYEGADALLSLLNWSLSFPDLFAELIRRLISNLKMCLPLFASSTPLVRLISNALLYYQKIRLKGDEHIDEVRATLLLFLSNCFDDPNCASKLISDSIFIRVFLSMAFEAPLRSFIFSQLKKLFIDDLAQQKQQHQISDETKLILETLELSFPEFKSIELTNQLLEVLCNLVNYQRSEFKKELSIISPILFKGFSRLDASNESVKYILNSLRFLTDTSNFFHFEKFHFEILLFGIQKALDLIVQSELNNQLFSKISHLMAGERLSTSTTSFVVRQPFAIWLLLATFLNTETFSIALKFVIEICQYHTTNCQQCRKGDVDLFLIKVIKDQKHIENEDLCFQLLTLIANDFCAPCVVESYVSMFQFEGSEVPPYFHKAMKYFVSMLTADLKVPQTMTKLVKSSVIEPTSFDFSVANGFTLAFWIYVERTSPQYFPSIVSLQDQNSHFFHLFLASNSLRFSHHENPFSKSEQIDTQIKLRQWSLVTVTYKVIPPYYYVIPTVDAPGDEEIIDNKVKKALNGPLKISIGGTLENSIDSDIPCILGPFAVYPILQQNQIQDLFSKGIRAIDQIDVTPIYVYNVHNRLENQNPSFSSVLTTQVGLTILFPLFSVNDSLLDSAFEAFSSSLMTDPSVEIEFANTECCSIIPYLLQERDKTQATYHLYLKFFQLMQNLKTEQLKHQLFGSIMTNFDLWIHSKIENFLLIVKHWSRTLFPSFTSEVSIITPFSSILNQMMIYFHEDDILNAKLDLKSPSASKCKNHLSVILQFIATISFDISDFLLLISYINHLKSNPLSLDATIILREIAHTEPSPLVSFASDPNFLPSLHSLLKIPKVCVGGLDVIILMFTKKIITNISLREEVIFCIELLKEEVIDKELFGLVVQQTVSVPELFSLSCYLSKFFGDQSVLKMIELFQPSPEYVSNDDFFYPIVTSYFLGKEAQYSILSFLAQSNYDSKKWSNINFVIKIVEQLCEDRTRELEAVYLNVLVDILMKMEFNATKNISLMKVFTKMAKRFIFFREPEEERSIFTEQKEEEEGEIVKQFTFDEISSKFEDFEFIQPDTVFGLRFGTDSEWIDSNLSMKIVELLEKKQIGTAISFDLMLAFYLVNKHTEFVDEHFRNFAIPKIRKESLEPFVALLDRKLQRFHIESTITSTYRNLRYDDNVFEKFIKKNSEKIKSNSKTFNNEFQTFFINCKKIEKAGLCNVVDSDSFCVKFQNEAVYKIVSKSLKNEKNWRGIRLCLTLPFAPWYRRNETDFWISRNTRLCGIGFPILSKVQSRRNLPYFNKENEMKIHESTENIETVLTEIQNDIHLELSDILFKSGCEYYRSNERLKTFIFITSDRIILNFNRYKRKVYFQEDIIEINTFIIQNEDSGIEIFYKDGKSILLDFLNKSNKENAMNTLQENVCLNNIDLFRVWRNREITTFDFLLRLNRKLSRSFNYSLRKPIFPPFLINDYNKALKEADDEITSSNLSDILQSSLQQKPIINTSETAAKSSSNNRSIFKFVEDNLNNENDDEDDDDEEEEGDEIAIDADDLDDSKMMRRNLNNFRMPSSSLIIKASPKKKKETENSEKKISKVLNSQGPNESKRPVPKIINSNIILNNNNQHFPGSFGRFVKKSSPYPSQLNSNQDSNLNLNLSLNSSNEMVTSNSISSMNSSTSFPSLNKEKEGNAVQLKLSEICSILSDGGTCSIDSYTKNSKFYQRRKILESDDVSANLNLWLSKVFKLPPISMRVPRIQRTFKPYFIKTKIANIMNASITIESSSALNSTTASSAAPKTAAMKSKSKSKRLNLLSTSLKQDQEDFVNISIDFVSNDGDLTKCLIEKTSERDDFEFESTVIKINNFDSNWNSIKIENLSQNFDVLIPDEKRINKIMIYDKEHNDYTDHINLKQITKVSCFATSENYFVIATETSSIDIFNKKNFSEPINTHKIFESPSLCCVISESFHTVVVGSQGCLIIASLESGTSIISIDIDNFTPNKIVITENFGFIVTQANKVEDGKVVHFMFLHNIEGKLINKKNINCDIFCLISWSDGEGLDFLSISDHDGKIMTCEAYDLDFSNVVKRCMSPVIKLDYCKCLKSLIAITSNGNIFIEPFMFNPQ